MLLFMFSFWSESWTPTRESRKPRVQLLQRSKKKLAQSLCRTSVSFWKLLSTLLANTRYGWCMVIGENIISVDVAAVILHMLKRCFQFHHFLAAAQWCPTHIIISFLTRLWLPVLVLWILRSLHSLFTHCVLWHTKQFGSIKLCPKFSPFDRHLCVYICRSLWRLWFSGRIWMGGNCWNFVWYNRNDFNRYVLLEVNGMRLSIMTQHPTSDGPSQSFLFQNTGAQRSTLRAV